MEARIGVVVEGGQRALSSGAHENVVDAGARKFLLHQNAHLKPPINPQNSQLGTLNHLLAGGIAGAFSKTCTAPLARLTILFQVFLPFPYFYLFDLVNKKLLNFFLFEISLMI